MAKVILHPIGSAVEEALPRQDFDQNLGRMQQLTELLSERRAEIHEG